jgi:integrase
MQTISQYLNSPEYQSLSEESQKTYGYAINRFREFMVSQGETEITAETVMRNKDRFIRYMQNLSGSSIRFYMQVVRIMMTAMKMPVPDFGYKLSELERRRNNRKQEGRWLTAADVDACYDYVWEQNHTRNHCIIRLLAESGLRVQELADLRWSDLNIAGRTARVNKSKTTVRTVIYSPATAAHLKTYRSRYIRKHGISSESLLFPIQKAAIKQIIKLMFTALGIKTGADGRGCHVFRHWAATNMYYNGGMALEDVAKLLGDKPQTIFNTYLHPTDEMLAARVEKAMGW